jgi:hypothetical protein
MSRDPHDLIMDQLLREILGGDRPRDMTARVLARAKIYDRTRRRWWVGSASALAACVAVAITLWALMRPHPYPSPVAEGFLVYGNDVERGAKLEAVSNDSSVSPTGNTTPPGRNAGGVLRLGGYVQLTAAPSTTFTLGGGPFREVVFLEHGHMDVSVSKTRGTFDIIVGDTVIHAVEGAFGIDAADEFSDDETRTKKNLTVSVKDGAVQVSGTATGADQPQNISAGSIQKFTVSSDPITVSSDPTFQTKPLIRAERQQQRADAATNPALTGRGARPNAANRAANAAARGNAQNPPPEPIFRQLQIVIGPGPYYFEGTLRHNGPYFVLQTDRGFLFLGTQDAMPANTPAPGPDSHVRVSFGKGHVISIESVKVSM